MQPFPNLPHYQRKLTSSSRETRIWLHYRCHGHTSLTRRLHKVHAETTPDSRVFSTVTVQHIEGPESFSHSLIAAIEHKIKTKKAPISDRLCTELLKLQPELFAYTSMELWQAVGGIGHVPSLIWSVLLTPVYKRKGNRPEPTKHGPIGRSSLLRKQICTALMLELLK